MKTIRISHPGISGEHTAATIRFYTEVLGMEIVLRQPNLDYAPEDHILFHVGEGTFIAYFLPRDEGADEGSVRTQTTVKTQRERGSPNSAGRV